ncbi:heme o synthase [soil metagenome]
MNTSTQSTSAAFLLKTKLADYSQLVKLRLAGTVVFSSVIAYAIAAYGHVEVLPMVMLFIGGFLVTGSANALNEVFEKDLDKMMKRTANRPLATGRMSTTEAILAAGIMGVAGILILGSFFNYLSAFLGAVSLLSYAFIYTPLKRISPIAVFVGAIPGAMPPLIGWVAATGAITEIGIAITMMQFLWQFPHFWAIAWIGEADYRKAGFKLLPSSGGKDRFTAIQIMIYIAVLIPVSLIPVMMGMVHWIGGAVIFVAGLFFMAQAIQLFRSCEDTDARKLMFMSIIYLPVVLMAMLIGRIG